MPLGQLSRVERERLGRFPSAVAAGDLREFFGLVAADSVFVRSRRGEANRLGLAVQLGCLRFLGVRAGPGHSPRGGGRVRRPPA